MLFNFANVLIFIILGLAMTFVIIALSRFLAPQVPGNPDKYLSYECGERPVGSGWVLFNFRFYAVALAFLIFEVELILVLPAISVFKRWLESGQGLFALIEIVLFIGILFAGLVYIWSRGDLKWSKQVPQEMRDEILIR